MTPTTPLQGDKIYKTKREKIFEILDQQGHILDQQTVDIFGSEEGVYKVSEHIRIWRKLRADQHFFQGKKIIAKMKGHRSHMVRLETEPENSWYKVGKEFYNTILL